MGLDYSYDLFFERAQLWDVLRDVAGIARKPADGEYIDVFLPTGRMTFPFTSNFKTEPIYFTSSMRKLEFDMSLFFEVDAPIQGYVEEAREENKKHECLRNWEPTRDEQGRIAIGYIYLYVSLDLNAYSRKDYDPNLIRLRFTAATTGMSLLFEESESIRKTFVQLLESHSGVYGLLNRDNDAVIVWLRGQLLSKVIPDPWLPLHEIERSLQERDE